MRSGYHVALDGRRNAASSSTDQLGFWKTMWVLRVHPKVKNFMWRFCDTILPSRLNLASKKCVPNPQCDFYGTGTKSLRHAFLECSWMRRVW